MKASTMKESTLTTAQIMDQAWSRIAPTWSLKNLIATNPLRGFEDQHFASALKVGHQAFEGEGYYSRLARLNRLTQKWCALYFDVGQASLPMPNKDQGLFKAVLSLLKYDNQVKLPLRVSKTPAEVIAVKVKELGAAKAVTYFQRLLFTLPGWSSYVQFLGSWSPEKDAQHLEDYLALRVLLADLCEIVPADLKIEATTDDRYKRIKANESEIHKSILESLKAASPAKPKSPKAQFMFCIDVRSEPYRRQLEAVGDYETFGVAGFFGLPIRIVNAATKRGYQACPVILEPSHEVVQTKAAHSKRHRSKIHLKKFYQSVKYAFTSPFALVEAFGSLAGSWSLLKTYAPSIAKSIKSTYRNYLTASEGPTYDLSQITLADQIAMAAGLLTSIGLKESFAPHVFVCGHGSETQNNAFATALDCGACAGHSGLANAQILCQMLNTSEVRAGLVSQGFAIPEATQFIPATHNTTTDALDVPAQFQSEQLDAIFKDLETVQKQAALVRRAILPGSSDVRDQDWSEVTPEWGLSTNAAFIIAPREKTAGADLKGQSFLHSYDPSQDPKGEVLAQIMGGPVVVAQWINSAYLFATVNNAAYGSGSKVTHNVIGKFGIMQGNGSDLMMGLPYQSLFDTSGQAYHKPARLMVLVDAPQARIDAVVAGNPTLAQLVKNEWIFVKAL